MHTDAHSRDPPPAKTRTRQLDSCKSHYGGAPRRERSKPRPTAGPLDNPHPTPPHVTRMETTPATPSPDPRAIQDGGQTPCASRLSGIPQVNRGECEQQLVHIQDTNPSTNRGGAVVMCWAIHKRAHPKQMVPSLEDPRTKRVEHALTMCGARQVEARAILPNWSMACGSSTEARC